MFSSGCLDQGVSLYQRARSTTSGSSERRRGRRRGTTQVPPQEAEEEEVHVAQEEDEAQQTASGSDASGSSSVYLRGKNLYMFFIASLCYTFKFKVETNNFLNHMCRSRQSP
jgi:hypothetical protein